MSESAKSILNDELPEGLKITTTSNGFGSPDTKDDVDIRSLGAKFPGDRFWVTNMYADVEGEEVVLTVWLSADMSSTTSAIENLKLLHNLR